MLVRVGSAWLLSLLLLPSPSRAQEVKAVPQRPSFSFNAFTTSRGYFEIEAGIDLSEPWLDAPALLKYGVADRAEIFVGGAPIRRQRHRKKNGVGDLLVGAKYRVNIAPPGTPALALQGAVKVPTADQDQGFGTGEVDYKAVAIVSQGSSLSQVDINLGLNLLGKQGGGGLREEAFAIMSLTLFPGGRVGPYGEIFASQALESGFTTLISDFGVSLSLSPRVVTDLAGVVGIDNAPSDWQLVAGITITLFPI